MRRFASLGSVAILSAVLPEIMLEATDNAWEGEILAVSLILALTWIILSVRAIRLGKREFWHFMFLPVAMYVPAIVLMAWFSLGRYSD